MTAVAADYDNDGWPDIYVACDSTPSWLFRNQRDGTFREEALERGVALSEDGLEQAGMGVGVGDYDLDGHLDIFKTHFADDTNVLYRNDGKGNFDDVTIRARDRRRDALRRLGRRDGRSGQRRPAGPVHGHRQRLSGSGERKLPAYPFKTPRLVFRNLGNGRFEELIEEAGPGVAAAHSSRGCAFGDFDNDGDVDVARREHERAAVAPAQRRLRDAALAEGAADRRDNQTAARSAPGSPPATAAGRRPRKCAAQSSFYSVNDRRLHFGLGAATTADLSIRWPNGNTERIAGVKAGQLVVVREGAGILRAQPLR